jgi:hypothetical protein
MGTGTFLAERLNSLTPPARPRRDRKVQFRAGVR